MKRTLSIICFLLLTINYSNAQNIGIGTTTPDTSALLDLFSTDKGFLPPRLALVSTISPKPVANPKAGLLVFNTAISGGTPINVSPGYYYWNGSSWYPLINKGNMPGDMQYWDGTRWIRIPLGLNGQVLTICNGIPIWGSCSTTVTIDPADNQFVGQLTSNMPNSTGGPGGSQFTMAAWTSGGSPLNIRSIMKFDFSTIPSGAIIDSAKLYFYAILVPAGGNGVDAHYGNSNSCFVRRITTNWTAPSPFSWNNPPAFSLVNEATIPQSLSSFENNIIDVTGIVKDMLTNSNNGFYIGLNNEVTYNVRQYVSSSNSDATKHPKLVITYH